MAPSACNMFAHLHVLMSLWLIYRQIRRCRHRRTYVRSILSRRMAYGDYRHLVQEMRLDVEYHFRYFRMPAAMFEELVAKVGPLISRSPTHRYPIGIGERLAMTLRYLASGDSQVSISFAYRVSPSTICIVIRETCEAIWSVLMPECLQCPPNSDAWKEKATMFHKLWNFPNWVGAIDGKHIVIKAPGNSGSNFYNYKGSFSIVLMAVCDANYCFTLVDIRSPGRFSDGGIYANSSFGQLLEEGNMKLPAADILPNANVSAPYVLVGDEAFPLKTYLMRPFPRSGLLNDKRIFNYRLSRARRVIENAFGILAARWRIFSRPIAADPNTVISIVKACLCLHNFIKKKEMTVPGSERNYCPARFLDSEDGDGNVVDGQWRNDVNESTAMTNICRTGSNMSGRDANEIRNGFMEYFNSAAGEIPWQNQRIREGYNAP